MFDQLFERRAAVRRHLNSPLLRERLEYLRYRAEQGYKLGTLRELAQDLLSRPDELSPFRRLKIPHPG